MKIDEYFKNFYRGTKDPSLIGMKYFMEEFGHPEKKQRFIHIAGTNGKGSVAEMLSNILVEAGYKIGKFMSPHLLCYNERVSINNENIADDEMEKLILELMPKVEAYNQTHDIKITLFELETSLALIYFARKQCDFVILETGLGGLYDCTNIVNAEISIITSIGYDHMKLLGNTLAEIAGQKAGIIKENGDTLFVKQEEEVNQVIEMTCQAKNNCLHQIAPTDMEQISYHNDFTRFCYQEDKNIDINLKGEKQPQNAAICLECVKLLKNKGFTITQETVRKALKTVIHKGRFETLCTNPQIIFDGAHNEPAIEHLKNTIHLYFPQAKKVFIISILKKKEYAKMLSQILQEDAIFIFTSGKNDGEYVTKEELYQVAMKITQQRECYQYELPEAIKLVRQSYKEYVTFIIGSFYVYETVVKELEEENNDRN